MILRTSRSVPWDIFEEHLDEASFLWGQWERALVAANYALNDVAAGPEARLLAHLDGLVLGGGPVAHELLLPALRADESERSAAAAWGLVQAEHQVDHQDDVIDAMVYGPRTGRRAIARALELSPQADLDRISKRWPGGSPETRASLIDIVAWRDSDRARPWLEPAFRSGEAVLLAAALRGARRSPDPAFLGWIEDALSSDEHEVRAEAIAAGVCLRSPAAWEACRAAASGTTTAERLPLGVLATSAASRDRLMVRECVADASARRDAIWALGFAGDVEAADTLVEATADETVSRIAAEAFSAITGLVLGSTFVEPGASRGPDVEEVREDDPPPIVRPEDHLLAPKANAVATWWRRARSGHRPGVRLILGRPRTDESVRAALGTTTMWRREVLWLDLARTTSPPPRVHLKAWTADQLRQLQADAAAKALPR